MTSTLLLLATASRAGDIKGKVSVQGIKSAENIAVYVDVIADKKFDAPAAKTSRGRPDEDDLYPPRSWLCKHGTTVDFSNSDPVGHNVYWPSRSAGTKSSLIIWAPGPKARRNRFNSMIWEWPLFFATCTPRCLATSSSCPTPYFAVTDKDGNFEIKNVPAGKYTLKTWSEDGKPTTQAVDVSAATATVELTVKK